MLGQFHCKSLTSHCISRTTQLLTFYIHISKVATLQRTRLWFQSYRQRIQLFHKKHKLTFCLNQDFINWR